MQEIKIDICVIGGGSGGLSIAAGAVQMGASVVLCESGKMGGDCLNYGCVPSKAIIESSRNIENIEHAKKFGINTTDFTVDFKSVKKHITDVISTIEPHDSVERFESLGVKVISEHAQLIDRSTVQAGDYKIKAKYIVLATGSRANIPNIKGIEDINYYTNENIFDLEESPKNLVILGGGPIGAELAQAHALLGSNVTIIELGNTILNNFDEDCRNVVLDKFSKLGIKIITNAKIQEFKKDNDNTIVVLDDQQINASHLLIAAGRKANIDNLALSEVNVSYDNFKINVDNRLRTNIKNIFAIGDIIGHRSFTHAAGYQAGIVIQNILFKLPAKVDYKAFPAVVYTTPEIAQVGMTIAEAKAQGARILTAYYSGNDRAQASKNTDGIVKVAVGKKGKILGASIVGEASGEIINTWTMAIHNNISIKSIASQIVSYPTISEINKRVAGSYFTETLYSDKMKKLVRFILKYLSRKV